MNIKPLASLPETCCSQCVQPFGAALGENAGVIAYSNCNTDCISEQSSTAIHDIYTGMTWQCVEYARRWLIQVKNVTFDEVDYAQQLWNIDTVTGVHNNKIYKFISKPNPNPQPPEIGDLVIYNITLPDFPDGHVGVVVGVNSKSGYVDIAEQNYTNDKWLNTHQYARRIILTHQHGKYHLVDKDYLALTNVSLDGVILGWKRLS